MRARSLTQRWIGGAMALAVVATALSTVTGATPSAQAQRPEGSLVVASTTLTALPASPTLEGVPVTFTATVTPAMGSIPVTDGFVLFSVDGAAVAAVPVSSGQASFTAPALAPGAHTIRALFAGSNTFRPGNSPEIAHQVDAVQTSSTTTTTTLPPTTTTGTTTSTTTTTTTTTKSPGQAQTSTELSSSANPSVFGQAVTFTAIVTPGAGSGSAPLGLRSVAVPQQVVEDGSVTFSDGGTVLATVAVEGGQTTFTTSSLSAGAHTITATFNGTATAAPSSATIIQQVNEPEPPTTQPSSTLPATR